MSRRPSPSAESRGGRRTGGTPSLESLDTNGGDDAGAFSTSFSQRPRRSRNRHADAAEVYTEGPRDYLSHPHADCNINHQRHRGDRNSKDSDYSSDGVADGAHGGGAEPTDSRVPAPTPLPHAASVESGLWPGEGLPPYAPSARRAVQNSSAVYPPPQPPHQQRQHQEAVPQELRQQLAVYYSHDSAVPSQLVDLDDTRVALPPGKMERNRGRSRRYEGDHQHGAGGYVHRDQTQLHSPALRAAGLTRIADPFAFTESVLLNYEAGARMWDSTACHAACVDQPGVCVVASFCCLAAPCLVAQERRLLLFQTVRSRYVCCVGAIPCCWPPALLRPELYMTYVAPSEAAEEVRVTQLELWQAQWQAGQIRQQHVASDDGSVAGDRYGDAAEASPPMPLRYPPLRTNKYPPVTDAGDAVTPPIMSVRGVSAVGSVTSSANGLPQYGAYNSVRQPPPGSSTRPATSAPLRMDPAFDPQAPSPSASGGGCSCCCGCCIFSSETNTCTLDYTQGCCLYLRHPTACCLLSGCPLCCLVAEVCCCLPCAALGNRLQLRRHYGLSPDPVLDDGLACCYSCCLTCLTGKRLEQRRQTYANGTAAQVPASCCQTFARSVAAGLSAACCLLPCLCCSLAQQRDVVERHGYPLLSSLRPSDITGML